MLLDLISHNSHIPGIAEYERNLVNYTNYILSCAQQLVKQAVFWFFIPKQHQTNIHQHISIHSPQKRQKKTQTHEGTRKVPCKKGNFVGLPGL